MNAHEEITPQSEERLFEHFVDEVDGVMCIPSGMPLAEIFRRAAVFRHRFPLWIDSEASLSSHVVAAMYAPASHRFGPFCDNILGMNWRLSDGRVLRIGERVAKTTTGYDWLRFLLHTGGRFGEPLDYVIRLRPDCGYSAVAYLRADFVRLQLAASMLLRGAWMHWWESVDFIPEGTEGQLRVAVHCPDIEARAFEAELRRVAESCGAVLKWCADSKLPPCPLPDLTLKTTSDRVMQMALEIRGRGDFEVVGLCYQGVLHISVRNPGDVLGLAKHFEDQLFEIGGDWHSVHHQHRSANQSEETWLKVLEPVLLKS